MYQVYVKGYVGNLGTKVLIENRFDELSKYFDKNYLLKLKDLVNGGVNPPLFIENESVIDKYDIVDREIIGKGGFLSSLWKICDRNKCGLKYSLLNVPILQGTIEICNFFDLNPYRLLTKDSEILFVNGEGEPQNCRGELCEPQNSTGELCEPFKLIGETTSGKKRIRVDNDIESYLTKDFKDEIDKIIKNYTKDYEKHSC